MSNIKSGTKSINELLDYDFFVPHFQRGYRWDSIQVTDLLNDIWDFNRKKKLSEGEFYCLQPVVVRKENGYYNLIDGQQRLTTIYVILFVLSQKIPALVNKKYSIKYETRLKSEEFLKSFDQDLAETNIDFSHMNRAKVTIEKWFSEKDPTSMVKFWSTLAGDEGHNVQVIWYEVDDSFDPILLFTNLNMGKIPLTNAELIKALLLSKENFLIEENDRGKQLRQLEIASEWDRIEQALRKKEFWYFLQNNSNNYENHIELIFDLLSDNLDNNGMRKNYDKYYTFRYYNELLKQGQNSEEIWDNIKKAYQTVTDWFENKELYHLVGYLITVGLEVKFLLNKSKESTKIEFKEYLKDQIKSRVGETNIEQLNYYDDKEYLRNILLLFNIVTIIKNEETNLRFQFGRYKDEKWDIEHIHSVQSEMPSSDSHKLDWVREVYDFADDEELNEKLGDYIINKPNDRKYDFDELYDLVIKKYSEKGKSEDINDISNLALLDSGTNRGYKNAVFPIKRKTIIEKDESGTFIPICTKNVFLKYYNRNLDQMSFWGMQDREAYKNSLVKMINEFLNIQNEGDDE